MHSRFLLLSIFYLGLPVTLGHSLPPILSPSDEVLQEKFLKAVKLPHCDPSHTEGRETYQLDVKDGFPLFLMKCKEMGSGWFGTVYSAKNIFTNEIVAVKVFGLYKAHCTRQEVENLKYLDQLLGEFKLGNQEASVLPFVRGIQLESFFKTLTQEGFKETYKRLARTVMVKLFRQGFAHEDLNPGNVLVSKMSYDPEFKSFIPEEMEAIDFGFGTTTRGGKHSSTNVFEVIKGALYPMPAGKPFIRGEEEITKLALIMYSEIRQGCPECSFPEKSVLPLWFHDDPFSPGQRTACVPSWAHYYPPTDSTPVQKMLPYFR